MKESNNKIVIVTGASQGIGRAIAIELVELGYQVHGTYNASTTEAESLNKEHGIIFHQVDLSEREQTVRLAQELAKLSPDALVNNAGVFELDALDELSFEAWDTTLEVNLTAPLVLSRTIGANMKAGSSIINISSTDGLTGAYDGISYSASKAGLISVTKSLGNTLGPKGIRVNAVAPGWIETDMVSQDSVLLAKDTNPLQRTARPQEIAKVVAFLISDNASYINGETLTVDGGGINVDYGLKKESGY